MKRIFLSNSKQFACVSDIDYGRVAKFSWRLDDYGYATRYYKCKESKKLKIVFLHKQVYGHKDGFVVDHKDRNKLNCVRSNLRFATRSQNSMNAEKKTNWRGRACSSKYKGVCFEKRKNLWISYIVLDGKQKKIGRFKKEEDAARNYNKFAKIHYGDFAKLNEIPDATN